jgi:hypothetical protein
MSVVMLKLIQLAAVFLGEVMSKLGRDEFRMQVASDGFNLAVRKSNQMPNRTFQEASCFDVFYVANVLRDEGFVVKQDTYSVVKLTAHTDHASLGFPVEKDRSGSIAS